MDRWFFNSDIEQDSKGSLFTVSHFRMHMCAEIHAGNTRHWNSHLNYTMDTRRIFQSLVPSLYFWKQFERNRPQSGYTYEKYHSFVRQTDLLHLKGVFFASGPDSNMVTAIYDEGQATTRSSGQALVSTSTWQTNPSSPISQPLPVLAFVL